MNRILRISCLITAFCLSACTTLQNDNVIQSVKLDTTMPDPNRLRFSGKGAGAGMMLMSSMGPMGMAVGVAIDEGIGKDIAAPLIAEGFDFEAELQLALQKALAGNCCAGKSLTVAVERYGFKTFGRADYADPISPELKITVTPEGQPEIVVDYPAKFEGELPLIPLEDAKVNGKISQKAMREALALVAAHVNTALTQPQS